MSDFYFSWDSNNLLMLNFKVLSFVTFLQCVQRELVPFLTVSGTESDTEENGFGTDLLLLRGLVSLVYHDFSDDDAIEGDWGL